MTPVSLSYCPIFLLLSLPNTLCLHVFVTHFLVIPLPSGSLCHPPLSHGYVCGHPSPNSKDFSWFLSSLATLQWSVLLAVVYSVKSSPLLHSPLSASLLCCCFSFPVSSLFNKYPYRFHFFLSTLWLWTWRGFTMQPTDLSTLTLWSLAGLVPSHHSFKYGTCHTLCTHLFSLMHASCLLSFSVLATLAFFWVPEGAGAFLT